MRFGEAADGHVLSLSADELSKQDAGRIHRAGRQQPSVSIERARGELRPFLHDDVDTGQGGISRRVGGATIELMRAYLEALREQIFHGSLARREEVLLRLGHEEGSAQHQPAKENDRKLHRSTSPNTISSEPSTADTSASMCPRQRKSIACRCAKPGALILHL